jgi:hypothetical protein
VVYDVIADPPVKSGRVHDRYAVVPDKNPPKKRGSDDTVAATGVESTTDEATLVPTALIAKTRNLWRTPPTRFVYVIERLVTAMRSERVHVVPPSVEYSVRYPVTALPPSEDGVAQYNVAPLNEAYTASARGAVGGSIERGVSITVLLAGLVPVEFTALTRNEWATAERARTVNVLLVDTPSLTVDHVEPASIDDSMM